MKKIGSKAIFEAQSVKYNGRRRGDLVPRTSDSRIGHESVASDVDVNSIVDGFETAAARAAVAGGVIAESRPGVDTREEVVCRREDVGLFALEVAAYAMKSAQNFFFLPV